MNAVSKNLPGVAEANKESLASTNIAGFIEDFVPVTNLKNIPQHITYCYLMSYIFAVRHTTESAGKGERYNGWNTYTHIPPSTELIQFNNSSIFMKKQILH